jgi:WD40 repeat protein
MAQSIVDIALSSSAQGLAVALDHSFLVFSSDPLQRKFQKEFDDLRITQISTAADSTFVAFVCIPQTSDAQRPQVVLWNNFYGDVHCRIDFTEPVVNVVLHPRILLVVLTSSVRAYEIQRQVLAFEFPTFRNPLGVGDLSASVENPLAAFPGDRLGFVTVKPLLSASDVVVFPAAKHPISLVRFSPDGSLVATASEKGTLIRIFGSRNGELLSVFRRGALTSVVRALCFSPSNAKLVAVSANGTVHLFAADRRCANEADAPRAVSKATIGKASAINAAWLHDQMLMILGSEGSFYQIAAGDDKLAKPSCVSVFSL